MPRLCSTPRRSRLFLNTTLRVRHLGRPWTGAGRVSIISSRALTPVISLMTVITPSSLMVIKLCTIVSVPPISKLSCRQSSVLVLVVVDDVVGFKASQEIEPCYGRCRRNDLGGKRKLRS
jgi:hypothetical protein